MAGYKISDRKKRMGGYERSTGIMPLIAPRAMQDASLSNNTRKEIF